MPKLSSVTTSVLAALALLAVVLAGPANAAVVTPFHGAVVERSTAATPVYWIWRHHHRIWIPSHHHY